ncbi:olfactory receptor class A-like protein 4 isoform X2 [Oryzias latipes]
MSKVLTLDAILFGLLVFSGLLGNTLVIYAVFQSAFETPPGRLSPSDTILVHLSLANLLTSLFRTVPIFVSDLGLDVSLSPGWCRVFMLLWMWWRAVGCWKEKRRVWIILGLVWGANLAFSIPALVYSTHVYSNATVDLMVISSTTRPLLGCIWEFPTTQQGSAFAFTSLALNEVFPLVLMICTNVSTLHALAKHIRAVTSSMESGGSHGEVNKLVSTERKAAHVIMLLVALFVVCWVLQVAAVTYYNHNRGLHAEGLLTVAHFSASTFVGFSPMVVALGHGKLRKKIMGMILVWTKAFHCSSKDTGRKRPSPKKKKLKVFDVQEEMRVINIRECKALNDRRE